MGYILGGSILPWQKGVVTKEVLSKGLCLDLERSRQTPDVGHHVDMSSLHAVMAQMADLRQGPWRWGLED